MPVFAEMSKTEWEELLFEYRSKREAGDKHHLRVTDAVSKSISPMMIHGVPVAKMFHTGAVALWKSSLSVLPVRPTPDPRIVLEVYPALVARKVLGGRVSYKCESKSKDTGELIGARIRVIEGFSKSDFGFSCRFGDGLAERMRDDFRGDYLDAMSAAVHACWSWTMREEGFGIPPDVDLLEGWIIDPEVHESRRER